MGADAEQTQRAPGNVFSALLLVMRAAAGELWRRQGKRQRAIQLFRAFSYNLFEFWQKIVFYCAVIFFFFWISWHLDSTTSIYPGLGIAQNSKEACDHQGYMLRHQLRFPLNLWFQGYRADTYRHTRAEGYFFFSFLQLLIVNIATSNSF